MSNSMNSVGAAPLTTLGPVDFFVLEFAGNVFNGEILRDIRELVDDGMIRIIDLVVVSKSASGSVSVLELHDLGKEVSEVFAPLEATISQLITRGDIDNIAAKLAKNCTAALLLYENTWAAKTTKALQDANGRVLAYQRIPHEFVMEALNDIDAMRTASGQS